MVIELSQEKVLFMDIAFVLPNIPRNPGGGAKVVFQYADYMAAKGNHVTIYYMTDRFLKGRLPRTMRKTVGRIYSKLCPNWYKFQNDVEYRSAFDKTDIKCCDVLIATAVMTAFFVDEVTFKCRKYYFIQGFETFYTSEDEVLRSYQLNLEKIVISKWLRNIVYKNTGVEPIYIPNGIDLNIFRVTKRISERGRHTIAFHYRKAPLKGCDYAIKTIEILREKYDDLEVFVIGNVDCPDVLKGKCHYYKNIAAEEVARINNMARVFMCTSIEEGFGLPGLEAMACGCALVTTNYAGAMEYAEHGVNALVSPVKAYESMADNVVMLFENDKLIIELSESGSCSSKNFDVNIMTKKFNDYIRGIV